MTQEGADAVWSRLGSAIAMPSQYRHTKIVCTIGPATESREHLKQLIIDGIDVMRLNMAHGTGEWVASLVGRIREDDSPVGRHLLGCLQVIRVQADR